MDGIVFKKEKKKISLDQVDKNDSSKKVCLKCSGGMGDVLISIGAVARKLKEEYSCKVTASVFDKHLPLVKMLEGVDDAISSRKLHLHVEEFDVFLDFSDTFTVGRKALVAKDYYLAVEEKLPSFLRPLSVGHFKLKKEPFNFQKIALHPGASNPNRRWKNEHWENLAQAFSSSGKEIFWLGAEDEFGYTTKNVFKLSDLIPSMQDQVIWLNKNAPYFIGNDSGFAHVAGLLRLFGKVLFGNTHPDDVIHRYLGLSGVHCFESHSDPPRTLDKDDLTSKVFLDNVSPERFYEAFNLKAPDLSKVEKTFPKKKVLSSNDSATIEKLKDFFYFKDGPEVTFLEKEKIFVLKIENRTFRIEGAFLENTVRAIREILEVHSIALEGN